MTLGHVPGDAGVVTTPDLVIPSLPFSRGTDLSLVLLALSDEPATVNVRLRHSLMIFIFNKCFKLTYTTLPIRL